MFSYDCSMFSVFFFCLSPSLFHIALLTPLFIFYFTAPVTYYSPLWNTIFPSWALFIFCLFTYSGCILTSKDSELGSPKKREYFVHLG